MNEPIGDDEERLLKALRDELTPAIRVARTKYPVWQVAVQCPSCREWTMCDQRFWDPVDTLRARQWLRTHACATLKRDIAAGKLAVLDVAADALREGNLRLAADLLCEADDANDMRVLPAAYREACQQLDAARARIAELELALRS
jgi:hypothetical protein